MGQNDEFVLIGAGLPRTGTMSTRAALMKLLKGDIYHMATVMNERPDHHPTWYKAVQGKTSVSDWRSMLAGYRGGVDYPISFFYKEIMEAFPNAKVLLNVRDPVKWYTSVRDAIYRLHYTVASWPCSWFTGIIGKRSAMDLVGTLSDAVPSCSSGGRGMFGSVAAGEQAAVQFWNDHVNEVKSVVPADRLLVWEVKEGWEPLCRFLDLPVPQEPFPRVNDTSEIEEGRLLILRMSWLFVVFVPAAMLLAAWYFAFDTPAPYLLMAGGYIAAISCIRSAAKQAMLKHGKEKKE